MKLVVPLVSQGELIGLLNLGAAAERAGLLGRRPGPAEQPGHAGRPGRARRPTGAPAAGPRPRRASGSSRSCAWRGSSSKPCCPRSCPRCRAGSSRAYYQPARAVGGDFYDFIHSPTGSVAHRHRRRDRQGRARGAGDGHDAQYLARRRGPTRFAGQGAGAGQRPAGARHPAQHVRHLPVRRPRPGSSGPAALRQRGPRPALSAARRRRARSCAPPACRWA